LLKLSLHRLGSKGTSEIQRGAPAWWKCTWLLTMLTGQFQEQIRTHKHKRWLEDLIPAQITTFSLMGGAESEIHSPSGSSVGTIGKQSQKRLSSLAGKFPMQRPPEETWESGASLDETWESTGQGSLISALSWKDGMPTGDPDGRSAQGSDWRGFRRRHTADGGDAKMPGLTEASDVSSKISSKEHQMLTADLDTWWQRAHVGARTVTGILPRYSTPLERLVEEAPQLFNPDRAEVHAVSAAYGEERPPSPTPCPKCSETRSASGWGNPGCVLCGGVEELCLPTEEHLFGALLRTYCGTSSAQQMPTSPIMPHDEFLTVGDAGGSTTLREHSASSRQASRRSSRVSNVGSDT
jgi:hypothetical protein